jgi:hypothetical protein
MSSTQPLFVIYDRQYGTYLRLYDYLPASYERADRYTLFDLQRQPSTSYSGNWSQQQRPSVRPQQQRPSVRPSVRPQQQPQQREPPKFVTDLILRDAATEGKLCPITLEPIEATEEFKVTPCYHAFNKEALGRWLREHSTCPECNQRV